MVLTTQRLVLRPWTTNDAESLFEYAKDPAIGPVAGWPVHTSVENSRATISAVLAVPETYAVTLKDASGLEIAPDTAIGAASLLIGSKSNLTIPEDEAEIGYWIGAPFWGRGFIPEAVSSLMRHAFDDLHLKRLWCSCFDGNTNSRRVIEKSGFSFVRTDYNVDVPLINAVRTLHVYAITKTEWENGFRVIQLSQYYRAGVFRHFSDDCKCSTTITHSLDVGDLLRVSKKTGTKFYINFLYLLCKVLNNRDDYRMQYRYQDNTLAVWNRLNPVHYVFHKDTETCSVVYSHYNPCYADFYRACESDIAVAKKTRDYGLDSGSHPNWFDASFISWIDYDSLSIELPDGYLHFPPIVNWGRYRRRLFRTMMPLSVRLNHAAGDGFLVADVFVQLQRAIHEFHVI